MDESWTRSFGSLSLINDGNFLRPVLFRSFTGMLIPVFPVFRFVIHFWYLLLLVLTSKWWKTKFQIDLRIWIQLSYPSRGRSNWPHLTSDDLKSTHLTFIHTKNDLFSIELKFNTKIEEKTIWKKWKFSAKDSSERNLCNLNISKTVQYFFSITDKQTYQAID